MKRWELIYHIIAIIKIYLLVCLSVYLSIGLSNLNSDLHEFITHLSNGIRDHGHKELPHQYNSCGRGRTIRSQSISNREKESRAAEVVGNDGPKGNTD